MDVNAMTAIFLQWTDPDTKENMSFVGELPVTIGRLPTNSIPLGRSLVSRNHARIETGEGGVTLLDLESRHGVTVNGRAVKSAVLAEGAIFEIGSYSFTVSFQIPDGVIPQPSVSSGEEDQAGKKTSPGSTGLYSTDELKSLLSQINSKKQPSDSLNTSPLPTDETIDIKIKKPDDKTS